MKQKYEWRDMSLSITITSTRFPITPAHRAWQNETNLTSSHIDFYTVFGWIPN